VAIENLATYTEVDAGNDLTVTTTKVDFDTMAANVVDYLYDSKGAAHWSGDFSIDFEHLHSAASGGFSSNFGVSVADSIGDLWTVGTCLSTYVEVTTYLPYVADIDGTGTWDAWTAGSGLTVDTLYYSTFSRTGNTLDWDIYSDSDRTTLVQNITLTIVNTSQTFEYMYAVSSIDVGEVDTITGYVQNIDLKEPINYERLLSSNMNIIDAIEREITEPAVSDLGTKVNIEYNRKVTN